MTPAEWWLIFDVKRPDKDQVTPDYDAMLDHLEKAQQQHEQLRIAEHGIDW